MGKNSKEIKVARATAASRKVRVAGKRTATRRIVAFATYSRTGAASDIELFYVQAVVFASHVST